MKRLYRSLLGTCTQILTLSVAVCSINVFHDLINESMQVRTLSEEVEGMAQGEEEVEVGGAITVSTGRAGQEVLANKY